ncbi:MAG: ATP-binding cassette domain-containing protein [Nitrospirae bacterium]|nr:ATP-binding cassette domain-containing protein [Nitrospirota bacterium]
MGISFSARKRLNGFTLDASWKIGNELAVIFGYSGAGKSMTLQMIAGLLAPDEGNIVLGENVLFDSGLNVDTRPQKRSIGYVFQDLALFPHMTAGENICYGGHGIDKVEQKKRCLELLRMFRIAGLEDRLPSQLSGGQKQRVALARALIRRPDALLLDEPFSALDMHIRFEMRGILKEIQQTFKIPVLLITHDADEALALADRMIVYAEGRVVQAGSPEEIFLSPLCSEVLTLSRFTGNVQPAVSCTGSELCGTAT